MLSFLYHVGYFVLDTNIQYKDSTTKTVNSNNKVGAYVINLERSKKRYEYVKNNIMALGISVERISAIDGNTFSQEQVNSTVDLQSYKQFLGHFPKLGTIGCSLSHIKSWQTFLDSNFEFAIIFEDDVSFDHEKLRIMIDELVENNKLWDINSFEISHNGTPLTIKSFSNNQKLVVYLTEVTHAGAYIINRKAAQRLLEKALPIRMPIDHYFTRAWEFDIKFTAIENPRLVYQTFGISEIAKTPKLQEEKMPIFTIIKRGLYKSQSYVIRFLYNLKIYILSFGVV